MNRLSAKFLRKSNIYIYIYIISSFILAVVLIKSNFVPLVLEKVGIEKGHPEITAHYKRMVTYHSRVDKNVPQDSVIFIGDSLTQSLCVSAVAERAVNFGIGSDTTVGVLERLPGYTSLQNAFAVVLAVGINDLRRRSNDQILEHIERIVSLIPEDVPLLLNALLVVDEKVQGHEHLQGHNRRSSNINKALRGFALRSNRIWFVDPNPLLVDESGNLADCNHVGDGVHLSKDGNALWIEALRKSLRQIEN
jgi:lysophospholipase L1-like esterase